MQKTSEDNSITPHATQTQTRMPRLRISSITKNFASGDEQEVRRSQNTPPTQPSLFVSFPTYRPNLLWLLKLVKKGPLGGERDSVPPNTTAEFIQYFLAGKETTIGKRKVVRKQNGKITIKRMEVDKKKDGSVLIRSRLKDNESEPPLMPPVHSICALLISNSFPFRPILFLSQ